MCVSVVFVFFHLSNKWYEVDWFTLRDFFSIEKRTTILRWKCVCVMLACCFIDIDCWILEKILNAEGNHTQWHISVDSCGFWWDDFDFCQHLPLVLLLILDVKVDYTFRMRSLQFSKQTRKKNEMPEKSMIFPNDWGRPPANRPMMSNSNGMKTCHEHTESELNNRKNERRVSL